MIRTALICGGWKRPPELRCLHGRPGGKDELSTSVDETATQEAGQSIGRIPLITNRALYLGDSPRPPVLDQQVQDLFVSLGLALVQVH